jgi:formyl-CoA transferase
MEMIGSAGIPAGAVLDNDELLHDPTLRERGMFVEIDHPTRGEIVIPGWPVKMSNSDVLVTPAPLLGQHNEEVLGEVLGYTPEKVAELREAKLI